jgi:hypothetical protein
VEYTFQEDALSRHGQLRRVGPSQNRSGIKRGREFVYAASCLADAASMIGDAPWSIDAGSGIRPGRTRSGQAIRLRDCGTDGINELDYRKVVKLLDLLGVFDDVNERLKNVWHGFWGEEFGIWGRWKFCRIPGPRAASVGSQVTTETTPYFRVRIGPFCPFFFPFSLFRALSNRARYLLDPAVDLPCTFFSGQVDGSLNTTAPN